MLGRTSRSGIRMSSAIRQLDRHNPVVDDRAAHRRTLPPARSTPRCRSRPRRPRMSGHRRVRLPATFANVPDAAAGCAAPKTGGCFVSRAHTHRVGRHDTAPAARTVLSRPQWPLVDDAREWIGVRATGCCAPPVDSRRFCRCRTFGPSPKGDTCPPVTNTARRSVRRPGWFPCKPNAPSTRRW